MNKNRINFEILWFLILILFLVIKNSWIYVVLLFIVIAYWIIKKENFKSVLINFLISLIALLLLITLNKINFFLIIEQSITELIGFSIKNEIVKYVKSIYQNEEIASFICLIILNAKDCINNEIYQMTIAMSIVYLICISGFHFMIIKKIIDKIFGKWKIISYWVNLLFFSFYSYLLSFSISSVRVLIGLIISPICNKFKINEYEKLSLITLIIVLFAPSEIYGLSYQLSFLSTFVVIYVYKMGLKNKLLEIFLANLFAFFITLPIIININYEISILSLLFSFIFGYLIPYLFVYLLLFTLFPFLVPLTSCVCWLIIELIKLFNSVNICITINEQLNCYLVVLYYLIYFGIILILYNRINKYD